MEDVEPLGDDEETNRMLEVVPDTQPCHVCTFFEICRQSLFEQRNGIQGRSGTRQAVTERQVLNIVSVLVDKICAIVASRIGESRREGRV